MAKNSYLLDTNVLSDLVRNPRGSIATHIARVGESNVCTSIVVAAELRYGACKRSAQELSRQLESILSVMEVLPLEEPADRAYGNLRTHLEHRGEPIGPNDMLIAAHALVNDMTVVTANQREFSRVPGPRVENWLDDQAG